MKLYMHPVSITSRPVRLFIAENGIDVDEQLVDLMTGEHYQEPFASINPNRLVPVLEDGDLRLTESSAILKYLADKIDSPAYPKDLKQRAKVNEMMDWFNTNFYREYGYGWIYPQLFPHHKRPSDEAHRATIAWGKERAQGWLKILNDYWLGPNKPYLCGDQITIADYFGASLPDARRGDPLRLQSLPQHPALARQHEEAEELAQGQRGALRLCRGGQGPAVRQRLSGFAAPDGAKPAIRLRARAPARRAPRT
jgi:glutathione S-transferase